MRFLRDRRVQIVFLLLVAIGYGFTAVRRQDNSGNDFPIYCDASAALVEGRSPYDVDTGLHGYVYPPFLAVAITPLTIVPQKTAIWIWYAFNVFLTVLAFMLTRTLVGKMIGQRHASWATWVSLLVHFRFFLNNYDMGQVNILLLVLLLWSMRLAIVDGKSLRAGLPLGLAVAIKPHALLLLVPFLLRGRGKMAASVLVTVVVATVVVPSTLVGPGGVIQMLGEWNQKVVVPSLNGTLQGSATFDQSPQAALRRFVVDAPAFGDTSVNVMSLSRENYNLLKRILQAVLGLVLLVAWLWRRKTGHDTVLLDVALAFAGMLMLTGYGLRGHFVVLLFPGAVLAGLLRTSPSCLRSRPLFTAILIVTAVLIVFSVSGLVGRTAANWALACSAVTAGMLLETAVLVWVRLSSSASQPPYYP